MMTPNQKVLALEAATVACEGSVPEAVIAPLRAWLDAKLDGETNNWSFGQFLDAQHGAVKALATCPELFGNVVQLPSWQQVV